MWSFNVVISNGLLKGIDNLRVKYFLTTVFSLPIPILFLLINNSFWKSNDLVKKPKSELI